THSSTTDTSPARMATFPPGSWYEATTPRSFALHPFWLLLIRVPERSDHQRVDGVERRELGRVDRPQVCVLRLARRQLRGLLNGGVDDGEQPGRLRLVMPLPPIPGRGGRVGHNLAVRGHAASCSVG